MKVLSDLHNIAQLKRFAADIIKLKEFMKSIIDIKMWPEQLECI